MSDFVHLRVRSEYSVGYGVATVHDLVARASELGSSALALTDYGLLSGFLALEHWSDSYGLSPIYGVDLFVTGTPAATAVDPPGFRPLPRHLPAPEDADPDPAEQLAWPGTAGAPVPGGHGSTLLVWAENETGLRNLVRMTEAAVADSGGIPQITPEVLAAHAGGLIGSTGGANSRITQLLRRGEYGRARTVAGEHRDIFGRENYYVELVRHNRTGDRAVLNGMLRLAAELDLPLVATNDVHYLDVEDAWVHRRLVERMERANYLRWVAGASAEVGSPRRPSGAAEKSLPPGTDAHNPGGGAEEDRPYALLSGPVNRQPDSGAPSGLLSSEHYFSGRNLCMKPAESMYRLFGEIPGACENTVEIADRCRVDFLAYCSKKPATPNRVAEPSGSAAAGTSAEPRDTITVCGKAQSFDEPPHNHLIEHESAGEDTASNGHGSAGGTGDTGSASASVTDLSGREIYDPADPIPLQTLAEVTLHLLDEVRPAGAEADELERLALELEAVDEQCRTEELLLLAEVVAWARSRGILIGPRQEWEGNSLLTYLLGLTPLPPDLISGAPKDCMAHRSIDFDGLSCEVEAGRFHEVMNYLTARFGDRAVLAVPVTPRVSQEETEEIVTETLADLPATLPDQQKLRIRERIEDIVSGARKFPELQDWIYAVDTGNGATRPAVAHLDSARTGGPVSQWGELLCGYMRLPILRITPARDLDVLSRCLELVAAGGQTPPDLFDLPRDDLAAYEWMCTAGEELRCIMHPAAEPEEFQRFLRAVGPRNFIELCAAVTMSSVNYRDLGYDEVYLFRHDHLRSEAELSRGRSGESSGQPEADETVAEETAVDVHPDRLLPRVARTSCAALVPTYGLLVWHEQLFAVYCEVLGYSVEEALDLRRRYLVDDAGAVNVSAQLLQRALTIGLDFEDAIGLEAVLSVSHEETSSGHFCAGVALVFYWAAYLAVHHPEEFARAVEELDD